MAASGASSASANQPAAEIPTAETPVSYWLPAYPSGHVHACRTDDRGYWVAICGRDFGSVTRYFPPDCRRCSACASLVARWGVPQ